MRFAYPCSIVFDEGGSVEIGGGESVTFTEGCSVTFPDVYGANTGGDSWEEALEMAEDCLATALGMYVKAGEDLPMPSRPSEGQILVPVPLLVAVKLALYTAMREQAISKDALATRLGISVGTAQKLVNPSYRSHISQLEKALRIVGRSLIVEDCDAVSATRQEDALIVHINP